MDEWTEQEEQQIIERAKTGDPEANYALSLWALHRGEEEPDEPRWNRLAAKCLVKAAQAGYGPAKEQMAALLHQGQGGDAGTPRRSEPQPEPQPTKQAPPEDEDEQVDAAAGIRRSAPVRRSSAASRSTSAPRPTSSARRPASRRQAPRDDADDGFDTAEASWDDGYDEEPPVRKGRRGPAGRDRNTGSDGGRGWGDAQWRKLEMICVFVCAVLLVIIAVMILSGRHGGSDSGSGSAIPPAGEVGAAGDAGTTVPGNYPDEATKSAIMAADLDIFPAPEDYETAPTTGTVSVSSEYLRLRKGPNTTYDPIAQMPNGTTVSVFAKKNDWDLILYQGDDGPIYGWCSSEYVILTAGAAAGTPASDAPDAAEG